MAPLHLSVATRSYQTISKSKRAFGKESRRRRVGWLRRSGRETQSLRQEVLETMTFALPAEVRLTPFLLGAMAMSLIESLGALHEQVRLLRGLRDMI